MTDLRGFSGSLRYRHISNYRLDGEDTSLASGMDIWDFSRARFNVSLLILLIPFPAGLAVGEENDLVFSGLVMLGILGRALYFGPEGTHRI